MWIVYIVLSISPLNLQTTNNMRWPDSLNMRFVGNWPFGPSQAVASMDNYVFLGSGGGVYIIDISDSANPVLVSDSIRTRGMVTSLRLALLSPPMSYLYVGAGKAGTEFWLGNTLPFLYRWNRFNCPGYTYDYDCMGTFRQSVAYVAAGDSGIRYISLDTIPQELGYYYTPGTARGLRYDGYIYVADGDSGLRIITSDPANPQEIGFYDTPGYAYAVDVHWDWPDYYAYIADGFANISIIDVYDPSNPQYAGQYSTGAFCNYNVRVQEAYLFILKRLDGFEVTTLNPPLQYIGEYDTPGSARDAVYNYYLSGAGALIADWDGGLRIVDLPSFQEFGHFDVPDKALGIAVSGDYAYMTDRYWGLRVFDISDPSYPQALGSCLTSDWPQDVDIAGQYAYVAAYFWGGLQVIDISTPSNPFSVGSYDTPGIAMDVYVQDTFAFVADAEQGLRIINIVDPTNPFEVGFYDTPGYAQGVCVLDSFAYIADGSGGGFQIINISDPTNPQAIGFYDTPGTALDVDILGSYACIADGLSGMRVIDVSDPTNPVEVGYFDPSDHVNSVLMVDSFCYIADSNAVRIINIATPSNPQEGGYYTLPDIALDLDVANEKIYVADGYCGLQIYENTLFGVDEFDNKACGSGFRLLQNPVFGGVFTIRLNIARSTDTYLDVYNTLGQKVKTYSLGNLNVGSHTIQLCATDLASGIYFLKLSSDSSVRTEKLLLLR